eukprot:gene15828-33382_t
MTLQSITCGSIPQGELIALQHLFNSTNGLTWKWNAHITNDWSDWENPCSWEGVGCDSTSSHINSLSLSSVGMNGTLPSQL